MLRVTVFSYRVAAYVTVSLNVTKVSLVTVLRSVNLDLGLGLAQCSTSLTL